VREYLKRGSLYLTSVSILNIGMYIAMMITPTMRPTPIIMIGSTIMMIGVGLMVGVIIIAMYMPMFKMLTLVK